MEMFPYGTPGVTEWFNDYANHESHIAADIFHTSLNVKEYLFGRMV